MKKHIVTRKPLTLARETVRRLSRVELEGAAGGGDEGGSWFNCTTFDINCRPPQQI